MHIYFISDLHLEARRPDISRAFLFWLEKKAPHADSLYILGDLFEVWIGDDYSDEFTVTIIAALKALSDSGTKIYIMHGNRDFLLGDTFTKATGSQKLSDPTVITVDNQNILLMHGDSLCTLDKEYMAFRQQARNPHWIRALLSKPLRERLEVARQLREASQTSSQHKSMEIMDVTPGEVVKVMHEHKVLHLIHGHTHRPAVHHLKINGHPAIRRVLGDWDRQGWVLSYSDGQFEKELIPY